MQEELELCSLDMLSYKHGLSSDALPNTITKLKLNTTISPGLLPPSITKLHLEHNQRITPGVLPPSLLTLKLVGKFNSLIDPGTLPASLTTLTLGHSFNQTIEGIFMNIQLKHLKLGDAFNQPITTSTFPRSLIALSLEGEKFKQVLPRGSLPPLLKHLSFGSGIDGNSLMLKSTFANIGSLQHSLRSFTIGYSKFAPLPMGFIPPTLTKLTLLGKFPLKSLKGTIPLTLLSLDIDCVYDSTGDIPRGTFPPSLTELMLPRGGTITVHDTWPVGLRKLSIPSLSFIRQIEHLTHLDYVLVDEEIMIRGPAILAQPSKLRCRQLKLKVTSTIDDDDCFGMDLPHFIGRSLTTFPRARTLEVEYGDISIPCLRRIASKGVLFDGNFFHRDMFGFMRLADKHFVPEPNWRSNDAYGYDDDY
ncbi:hypothetical protein SAMD00019534_010940, partial [Acytostelium subglobosum LB1]|uniref:hypothetical protein n=1 Tax=Acytostelium subglobosum LB1 TaxID=1410327 RepID=UPI000644F03D